jgi:hypothetical protein
MMAEMSVQTKPKSGPRRHRVGKGPAPSPKAARAIARAKAGATGARTAIVLTGVPEELVREAESRGDVDWRPLAGALDGLFMATGGERGVHIFWKTPRGDLKGKRPLDVVASANGPHRLEKLVRDVTVRTQLAKLR